MRLLLTFLSAICLPLVAQSDRDARLQSLLAAAHDAQARSDFHAAAEAYRQGVAIRPDLPELWSNLGVMQYSSHEYPDAEQALRHALGLKTSLFVPNLFLGLDLLELKRPREAVAYLLTAQKLNPQDTQVLVALGRAFHILLDPARSREWYQRATELAPRNGEAWYGLGISYFDSAESAGAKLTTAFPQSPYVARLSADLHAETEPRLPARASPPALEKISEHDLQQFADDAFSSGDFPAAALAADRLTHQYPNDAAGWYWAVRTNQKLGVAALARAGEVEPDSPRIHALLGDAYQRQRMFREAEDEYLKMLALKPDNIPALAGLAAAYLRDEHLQEANATARKALAQDPEDGELNILMGEIFVAQHDYAGAEPYLKRSLNTRPDLLPRVHALLGRVYARTGRTKEAIAELRQGLVSDDDGSVHYQLARLYQNSGDDKAAAAMFEKSHQIRAKRHAISQEALAPVQ